MTEVATLSSDNPVDEDLLDALYQLNIVAKEYGSEASDAYESGYKAAAREYSLRKRALYGLKQAILEELDSRGDVETVKLHEIHGNDYYCFYVDDYSFHSPVEKWGGEPATEVAAQEQLEGFEGDPSSREDKMTEREALEYLAEVFESANAYLPTPFIDGNYRHSFAGWSYLPGVLEEGDRVPQDRLHDHNGDGDFVFEIGDTFLTGEGECEIIDRYHAYLTPLWDRSPLLQRPVYDVILDGEKKECVRKQRMEDDWFILADSIADPVPNVSGTFSKHARRAIEIRDVDVDFEIGDIIELEPWKDGGEPTFCRITEVHVCGCLLMGRYEPVSPGDDAPQGLAIEEIAEHVVAVHDEPPL